MRASLLFFLLPPALPAAHAWAETLPSEQDFLGEAPVVLSASRLSQPLGDAPAAMTVIDRGMIKALGVRQVHEVLRLVPGFYVDYLNGHMPVVSYHGLGDSLLSRIQVLVDGRSIYNPVLGGIDWADLPLSLEDVDRIEVVRGPSSPAHGINAFLAVVNIYTRHASQEQGTHVSLAYGKEVGDATLSFSGAGENLDYRITIGMRSDEGITAPYFDGNENAFIARNDSTRLSYANLRGDYRLNNRDQLTLQLGWSGGPRGTGNRPGDELDYFRDINYQSNFGQFQWRRAFDSGTELNLSYHHYYRRQEDVYTILPLNLGPLGIVQFPVDDSYISRRDEVEMQYSFAPSSSMRVVAGAGLRHDRVDAPMTLGRREENRIGRLFGHLEWRPGRVVTANAGLMVESNDYIGVHTSPRLALNLHPLAGHTLRYSYAEALRSPTIFEEKANRKLAFTSGLGPTWYQMHRGNQDLLPEKIYYHELGYIWRLPEMRLTVDLNLFRNTIKNIISTDRDPYAGGPAGYLDLNALLGNTPLRFGNRDWTRQWGHELELTYRPRSDSFVIFSWSRLDMDTHERLGKNFDDATPSTSGAPDTYRLFASHRFGNGVMLSGLYVYQDELLALGGSDNQPFQRRWDLRIAKDFMMAPGKKGEIALVTQNAFNERNYGYRGNETNFERRAYITATASF